MQRCLQNSSLRPVANAGVCSIRLRENITGSNPDFIGNVLIQIEFETGPREVVGA